jgi:hypothetical protein
MWLPERRKHVFTVALSPSLLTFNGMTVRNVIRDVSIEAEFILKMDVSAFIKGREKERKRHFLHSGSCLT